MTTTPIAAAASTARQRLAAVLGTIQSDPNIPAPVQEILQGLARAMGPLFQLERGSQDLSLFQTARNVLQETLAKIQTTDQSIRGVPEATSAVAESLGVIFKTMREAGLVQQPAAAGGAAAPQPAAPSAPAAAAANVAAPASAPVAAPVAAPPSAPHPVAQPVVPAAQPVRPAQPVAAAAPVPLTAPNAAPIPLQQRAGGSPAAPPAAAPVAQRPAPSAMRAPTGAGVVTSTVPVGPNGLPRLESEVGVHSETNFYTDFLGDISNHGGIFVATFHVLPIGAQCEVVLTFPGNLTAEIRGIVRWKRENAPGSSSATSPGLGIEITQADNAGWDLIHRFIRKREPIMHEM